MSLFDVGKSDAHPARTKKIMYMNCRDTRWASLAFFVSSLQEVGGGSIGERCSPQGKPRAFLANREAI